MPGFGDTLSNFARYRKQFESMSRSMGGLSPDSDLIETADFGTNPGNLLLQSFVPDELPPSAPLVVVLHGCTQTAASYDHGAGWTQLAARSGFAVLLPEQQRANNPNLCFNWFLPEDTRRDQGEVASIKQMIDHMIRVHGLDAKRVFVTGLSAGGAMTSALLACYPETFAAGAIIAGLPYGCASNTQEALAAMFQGGSGTGPIWGDMVRSASSHRGRWPRVSVWHGSADTTVKPTNAAEIVKQWIDVHGASAEPSVQDKVSGFPHRIWMLGGDPVVEAYSITGMAHGTPIDPAGSGSGDRCGVAGPHILDVGISSTAIIARSWGILGYRVAEPASVRPPPRVSKVEAARPPPPPKRFDVGMVINKALRAAGLMK
jgi:poly(hydroxyalkanoate) depolymerase family esterase